MSESCRSCGRALLDKLSGFCPRCLFGTAIAGLMDDREELTPSWEEMGEFLPDFVFEGELGRGGSGVVYLAREKKGEELVAVKVLAPALAKNPEFAERFRREAKVMSELNHPHVVEVKGYGEQNGLLYLMMEFLPGHDVSKLLKKEGKLSLERACELLGMVCEGLAYSHGKGILHRDIKPGNILLDSQGGLKVADFGLAKILNQESEVDLTMTNAKMGTPRYMAPEQMKEEVKVDERTDVYSLGVVFYELLTGKAPGGSFALPSELVGVSERVDEVVLKAMSDEPDERFASVGEFREALDSLKKDSKGLLWSSLLVILCVVGLLVAVLFPDDYRSGENIKLEGFDWVFLAQEEQSLPEDFPSRLKGAHEVILSDSDQEFGVALMADGSLRGFGSDHYGQSRPPKGNHFVRIAVGRGERAAHALALQKDGRVLAWGDNSYGQTAVPVDLGKAEDVMAGEFWSAAKVEGVWKLWGAFEEVDVSEEEKQDRTDGKTVAVTRREV